MTDVFRASGPIDRPRLTALAGALGQCRLALVHAPAGCGKTTLLSQWRAALMGSGVRVAWLSIGEDEHDPISLAAHLIPEIQLACGLEPSAGAAFPGEEAFAHLGDLADQACRAGPLAVMVDDYHLAREPAARRSVEALLAGRTPGLTVVLASRRRPDLPLGRLRANGELIELSDKELRFSETEMQRFFRSVGGAPLTEAQNQFVQERTEGWAAGLRLMALALDRSFERDLILAGTPGSRSDFADYFLEEVIEGLEPALLRFLLQVSILETMQAELCAAVTGEAAAGQLLQRLERDHLFTTSLPGQEGWYRFHHLFLEFLRARLLAGPDDGIPELHRRAAEWFVGAGRPMEAVRHAFLARRPEWAAELIERYCVFDYLSYGRFDVYYRWMRELPEAVLASRPLLSFLLTWRYINGRRFAQAGEVLAGIERACAEPGSAAAAIAARTGLDIEGRLHLMRALVGAYSADLETCRRHIAAIGRPLDHLAFGQVDLDSIHSYLAYHLGDLEAAQRLTWKAHRRYEEIECHWGRIHSLCISAMASMAGGALDEARAVLEQAVETGVAVFSQSSYMVALPCGLLGALLHQTGAVEEAERFLLQAVGGELPSGSFGLAERIVVPAIALARLYDASGRTDQADALLVRASRLAYQAEDIRLDFQLAVERADRAIRLRRFRDVAAELARVEAQVEALAARFPPECWAVWQPHAVLEARRLALAGRRREAAARLSELGAAAARQQRYGHAAMIEALAGEILAAAEPAPLPRPPAARLPQTLAAIGRRPGHARFGLTERERAVLDCLGDGLTNAEIGERLEINVNTVKTHLKSVYSKLDARNRAHAALLAQELREGMA
ncbi:helix-turn-helix transcriptional regulator [Labrys wisconsinensis]|uniref:LuxR family maltose regulon positive regulatory protein n=1 Tax=Labrys wisconsinensis TaxID=425677 RepID=A0ABU0J0E9_9HYPH|nr:LuxR C-terminal-related transcriptional regulator [Labrys wisconsinensis]MDQ0467026.1 LuxR family maltose regulon positive regulatory protein [Labrys wisconsinensis]